MTVSFPLTAFQPQMCNPLPRTRRGDLWIADQDHGLLRYSPENKVEQIPWSSLGRKDAIGITLAGDSQGGLWIGLSVGGGVVYFKEGQFKASYTRAEGLGQGLVRHLRLDRDGALWAATEGGLSRIKNGRAATLTLKNGLPCEAIQWAMEDDAGSFWLNTPCGLVRITRAEMHAWTDAVDRNQGANRIAQPGFSTVQTESGARLGAASTTRQSAGQRTGDCGSLVWTAPGSSIRCTCPSTNSPRRCSLKV